MSNLTTLRRRRGVAKRSLTNLCSSLRDLEVSTDEATKPDRARQLMVKLETVDKDFRAAHLDVMDLVDEDSPDFEKEHEAMDKHEEDVTSVSLRLRALLKVTSSSSDTARPLSRKLTRIKHCLEETEDSLSSFEDSHVETSLLEQHQEKVSDMKKELSSLYDEIITLDLPDDHEVVAKHTSLEALQFRCAHRVKKLLNAQSPHSKVSSTAGESSKLPKLNVPTFDGDVLHWQQFWEQFHVSIHSRKGLSNAEKLVYLQQAIKQGSAKSAIEGLSQTGDQYGEAIDCLKSRYNRPRLIHRAHVRIIMDTPSLKDGEGKELRRLHDVLLQHLRALKTMKAEPDPSFVTSLVELKLDPTTLFEWQKHSQTTVDEVPHYNHLLEFLDLRAQASEALSTGSTSKKQTSTHRKRFGPSGKVTSFTAATGESGRNHCVLCTTERHPLYACPKFRAMSHDVKLSTLKQNNLCLNCFSSGHFVKQCKSAHRCRKCQRPHHTLLHVEAQGEASHQTPPQLSRPEDPPPPASPVVSHAAVKLRSSSLLMTCRVLVFGSDGMPVEVRALLDNGSTSSFVSERLVQSLRLPRSQYRIQLSGISGSSASSPIQSVANFKISSTHANGRKIDLTAIVLSRVTCDLPVSPVPFDLSWTHLTGLPLADPSFGEPNVWMFCSELMSLSMSSAKAGGPALLDRLLQLRQNLAGDDLLRKFWEVEESPTDAPVLTPEERFVLQHFEKNHFRTKAGRFVVPLPRKPNAEPIGESRSQAVRRFLSLERSLHQKDKFREVDSVIQEYFSLGHAEAVPIKDADKDPSSVFYLPMHVVYKSSSSTTKIRAVFDASAKSSSGVSLNDTLLVGPTIHPPLVDILLRFRMHRVALTADVSKMYRAIELVPSDRDFHRFIWRSELSQTLIDYRMTRATFGVSASCFAANTALKQNAIELTDKFPLAAEVVRDSFYVDDTLSGADSVESAITLQRQLQDLLACGGFLLRKWNSNESVVLEAIWPELRESKEVHSISGSEHTKTLGLEWNTSTDTFYITTSKLLPTESVTKRTLVSEIAKVFDVLGWFSPAIISVKILLQRVWEEGIDWDDPVPETIQLAWQQWRSELPSLLSKGIPRCYFPRHVQVASLQIHGFCDATEDAYAGAVYLRIVDSTEAVHTSLVMAKTRVAPIKRLSIPRLELCGARVLAKLLHHVREIFQVPLSSVFAWTDSTIVLDWLVGNPRRFKTYVGNRVSEIIDRMPADRWGHVASSDNPADCASRGVLPSQLLEHDLWWTGPHWLFLDPEHWPKREKTSVQTPVEEEKEVCLASLSLSGEFIVPVQRYSTFTRVQRIVAWILRFVSNCRPAKRLVPATEKPVLSASELVIAERYLVRSSQEAHFIEDISSLQAKKDLPRGSSLLSLHPFVDSDGTLRVGGRESNSSLVYSQRHPMILHGSDHLIKLLIRLEHIRLLHAGATLVLSSLSRRFHVLRMKKTVRSVIRQCIVCRRHSTRPSPQMLGQLPSERVTPGTVFEKVGVDYAGPVQVKYGMVRKPTVVKSYICVFVSLTVKAVHLEAVTDLTSDAFIAALRRFVARRGAPVLIWSDNGTNFVGANNELRRMYELLSQQDTEHAVTDFCSHLGIEWRFIPEHAPHFGGLWEAAVKSAKTHLRRIVGEVRLTFEELSTILTQIEACMNSRPLVSLNTPDEDGIEALTPGHFLIGRPLCALPDPPSSYRQLSLLKRWDLCQNLSRHFWKRWSAEYLTTLNKFRKWQTPTRNLQVSDVVILKEDNLVPTKWPLARVSEVYHGKDGLVRVATVTTSKGTYKRPVTKLAPLLTDIN